jgi:tripartite-type tricarboxylate transporter receptor subunit TctC
MTKWKTTAVMAAILTAVILTAASVPGAVQTCDAETFPDHKTFPDHSVRLVVPYTAGGPVDVTSRIVAQRLGDVLGHPVVVENRPGGSGIIGNKAVAAAEPDGHTLLIGNTSTLAVYPAIARVNEFDVMKRLTPVAKLVEGYEVMVVDPAGPLADAGFVIERLCEPTPGEGLRLKDPKGYDRLCRLPAFIFVRARKSV